MKEASVAIVNSEDSEMEERLEEQASKELITRIN